jgi:TPR repeat protein
MYSNRQGVVRDYAEAMRWYKLAAAQGESHAQYNLGGMYSNGRGVVQDYAEAMRWYKSAAARGHADAQFNLGFMYSDGRGVVQDYVRAHMWFNLAAAKGDADSVKQRTIVAKKMTPQQIAEAQKLARECQARNFKKCD